VPEFSLSIVMPVYNEAEHLPATIEAVIDAVERSDFAAELIVVDDGSADGSPAAVRDAVAGRLPLQLLEGPRAGRFKARQAGVTAANATWVLLLDARIRLHANSLRFLFDRISAAAAVWNGHVIPQLRGNPFGAFGNVLVHLAWARYFDDPRSTSYGLDEFDHFPKGTSCFLAPKELLLESMAAFRPRVSNWRLVSDDTQLIRWIAGRHRIHISPDFGCDYQPRTNLSAFLRNALYRGSTFFDGHGRRESRFYPVVVAFFPVSAALAVAVLRRPLVLPIVVVITAGGAAAVAARARRPLFETASFALLTPLYAVAHGAGMWRSLAVLIRQRLAATLPT
jgi:glycosyltransferase involved in cell wall biosynthesis